MMEFGMNTEKESHKQFMEHSYDSPQLLHTFPTYY